MPSGRCHAGGPNPSAIAMKNIFVVESQPLTLRGLVLTIQEEPGFELCGQADSAVGAQAALDSIDPDLVIISNHLLGMCGLDLTLRLKAKKPDLKILILSPHEDALCAERALRAGAQGYLTKFEATELVLKAAHIILDGGYYVCEKIASQLFKALAQHPTPIIPSPVDMLSEQELKMFDMVGHGLSSQDIAERMGVSVKTVETYRARAREKLRLADATALTQHAFQWVNEARICPSWKACFGNSEN